ncbi:MAG: beta-glucuronidase [Bacteroidaceae bacterium]|nr:beta-glucuronidase [Bacteroidaceae bacterium]
MKRHFLLLLCLLSTVLMGAQDVIDLSGEWQFQVDRENKGEAEGWYLPDHKLNDRITLPASMPEKLKGDDISINTRWVGSLYDSSYFFNPYMAKYRKPGKDMKLQFFLTPDKHYVGRAWYKRTVVIDKKTIASPYSVLELILERPHIVSQVWINEKKIQEKRNSLSVPHVYSIYGLFFKPGVNTITVCIDNNPALVPVGQDSHSITDQTQGDWNGIVGRMVLRPASLLKHVQVYPDVDGRKAVAHLTFGNITEKEQATITVSASAFNTDKSHELKAKSLTKTIDPVSANTLDVTLDMGNEMLLWDEFNPQLYRLTVSVKTKTRSCTEETVFGMRKVEIRDKMFYVNGREVLLRGTVENCDFPNTGYPPMDVETWVKLFKTCKSYGLNHMRFHTYCPPEAAFLAADMVGFYLQPEGPSWPNHGVKLGRGEFIDDYLYAEGERIVDTYGNHPSFTFFAFGNEPAGNWVKWSTEAVAKIKKYDPRHLYCGFSVGGGWAWQPGSEFAVKAGARGLNEWARRAPESTVNFAKNIETYNGKDSPNTPITMPFVSHETGQWCAFPNFEEISKYTGVNKAKNFEIFRDLLRDNGMASRAHDFLMASGKLQALCYKAEIERTLRTPNYAGFQLLSLNDYSGQGTALVGVTDVFFDNKGYISEREFREFCSPIVPLAKIKKFTYKTSETFEADMELSQFSDQPLKNTAALWTVTQNGQEFAAGHLPARDLPIGCNIELGQIRVPLGSIQRAGKYTLTVSIPGTEAKNHWDFWVYPEADGTRALADEKTQKRNSKASDFLVMHELFNDVYITDSLDKKAQKLLKKGGKVLICAAGKVSYGKEVVQQFTPVFWNTSWFKMRPPHTTGIFVENSHSIFDLFPTDYHSDMQWWELVNRAQVMQFTDFPRDFQPLVQSIDTWFVSRKIGMLFEANVGQGKLVMTTMDINRDLDKRIVARQMRTSILNYMLSDKFRPQWTIEQERIADLFTKVAGAVNMYTKDSPDELKPALDNSIKPKK